MERMQHHEYAQWLICKNCLQGARDHILAGESTFFVELSETASMLQVLSLGCTQFCACCLKHSACTIFIGS